MSLTNMEFFLYPRWGLKKFNKIPGTLQVQRMRKKFESFITYMSNFENEIIKNDNNVKLYSNQFLLR